MARGSGWVLVPRAVLKVALSICDAVPTHAHLAPESDPIRRIGEIVNVQGGYAAIRDAYCAKAVAPAERGSKA